MRPSGVVSAFIGCSVRQKRLRAALQLSGWTKGGARDSRKVDVRGLMENLSAADGVQKSLAEAGVTAEAGRYDGQGGKGIWSIMAKTNQTCLKETVHLPNM